MTMPTTFFTVCVSMTDWVYYPDESECFFPNMDLKKILGILDVDMNISELYEYYFDDIDVGTGDVFVYKSSTYLNTYFIVNLYREMTDQLDCVVFYINSPDQQVTEKIKPFLRHFFDHASYQFSYRENCAPTMDVKVNESKSGDVYKIIEENGYEQKIIIK